MVSNQTDVLSNNTDYYFGNKTYVWLKILGLNLKHEIMYLSLLPICLIGLLLNILTLLILRGESFRLPIFSYLRVYAIKSGVICILLSTLFLANTRRFFTFTNSQWTMIYSAQIQIPVAKTLFFYESCLDILLSFDRAVMFSSGFHFYKKIKPNLICLILFVISCIISCPFWIIFTARSDVLKLNETEVYKLYSIDVTKWTSNLLLYIVFSIVDFLPFLAEIPLNIIVIVLLKRYLKRKLNVRNSSSTRLAVLTQEEIRTKKMELKVTFLVVIMSFFSIA
jgi:hypothetical protein